MSHYTPRSLLEEARFRLDVLPADLGVAIVEGEEDKSLIARFAARPEQIIACGGKEVLTQACIASRTDTCDGVVFLRDCDYDVSTGVLDLRSEDLPAGVLILSQQSDVEIDLIAMGRLRDVVCTFRPSALESDETLAGFVEDVLQRSIGIAEPIGRLRFANTKHQLGLCFEGLSVPKVARGGTTSLLDLIESRSHEAMRARGLRRGDLSRLLDEAPSGLAVCNGHDLISAIAYTLRNVFSVKGQRPEHIGASLRLALRESDLQTWEVGKRIRAWEERIGRRILAS